MFDFNKCYIVHRFMFVHKVSLFLKKNAFVFGHLKRSTDFYKYIFTKFCFLINIWKGAILFNGLEGVCVLSYIFWEDFACTFISFCFLSCKMRIILVPILQVLGKIKLYFSLKVFSIILCSSLNISYYFYFEKR